MKLLTWITATLCALGATATAYLYVQPPLHTAKAAEESAPAASGEAVRLPPNELEDLRGAFREVEATLERERSALEAKVRGVVTQALKDELGRWESDSAARPELARAIEGSLAEARGALRLDLLVLVTQENEVVAPPLARPRAGEPTVEDEVAPALARAGVVVAAEPVFRDGKPWSGVEAFPSEYFRPPGRFQGDATPAKALSLAAGAPVWLRPDAPHSVVLGGVALESLEPVVKGLLRSKGDRHRWHVIGHGAGDEPVVLAGERLEAEVLRDFHKLLLQAGSSADPAFADEAAQAGRWTLLSDRQGRVFGAWGVTLAPAHAARLAASATPGVAARTGGRPWLERHGAHAAGGLTAALGLLTALLASRSRRRAPPRQAPPRAAADPSSAALPAAPPPRPKDEAKHDLISQFEINWKTFASYTQDLLHQKLKEIEDAPQQGVKEVREQVARLAEALVEVRKDLSEARSEVKDTTHGVVEKVAHLVEQGAQEKRGLPPEGEELLLRIEGDFEKASAKVSQLDTTVERLAAILGEKRDQEIEERVAAEVEKLQAQWNERVAAFAAEIEEAKRQGESLVEDLATARETEASLRADLAAAGERQAALERDMESVRAEAELLKKDREGAWRREREVIAEADAAKGREEDAVRKAALLEETLKGLEGAIADARGREEAARRELEEARAGEEKLREAIKEIYREEGRFQKDLERKEREFTEERERLNERLAELEAARAALDARISEAEEEAGRLGGLAEARGKELDALRRAFEAAKDERAHFEAEAKLHADELGALRAEMASRDATRHRELEEDVARLRGEAASLARDLLAERRAAVDAARALEARKVELAEQAEGLARARQEAEALRAQLEQTSLDLERTRRSLDVKEQEIGPAKEALEKALQSSLAETKRLRDLAEAREAEARAGRDSADRVLDAARADAARHEQACREAERRLRSSEEERLRLKAQLTETEARWHSRLGELEVKAAEADRKVADAARRLAEAEASERALRSRLEAAQASSRSGEETSLRLQAAECERRELMASIDRLGKELERARSEAEGIRRFQGTLVDGCIPAALVAVDASLKVFAWNPRAEALWGRPAGSVLGKLLYEVRVKGLGDEVIDLSRRVLREGRPALMPQTSFTDEEGKVRHVHLGFEPILGPEDEVLGAVLIAEDITEKVEHEIEAKLQTIFSQSLTRSLPAALVVVDGHGRVISWNRGAEAILGLSEKSALGQSLFTLATPLAKEAFRKRFEEAKRDGATHRVRVRLEAKGVPAQFVLTQSPFLGSDDTVRGTILLIQEAADLVEGRKG
ncbi:MAG: PAS domain-containing protein [Planctomycetes bacterium]|nr:PAS domain-containing protein [Planctomycetota bacterium]